MLLRLKHSSDLRDGCLEGHILASHLAVGVELVALLVVWVLPLRLFAIELDLAVTLGSISTALLETSPGLEEAELARSTVKGEGGRVAREGNLAVVVCRAVEEILSLVRDGAALGLVVEDLVLESKGQTSERGLRLRSVVGVGSAVVEVADYPFSDGSASCHARVAVGTRHESEGGSGDGGAGEEESSEEVHLGMK